MSAIISDPTGLLQKAFQRAREKAQQREDPPAKCSKCGKDVPSGAPLAFNRKGEPICETCVQVLPSTRGLSWRLSTRVLIKGKDVFKALDELAQKPD